jgi:osmotically-inducible protein OsmY
MAHKGDKPNDMRSEAERVRARGHGSPFGFEPSGEPVAAERDLRQRVLVTLQGEPEWANAAIEVDVRGTTVWLKGSVDTVNAKYRVEETVKRVRGVEEIENDLAIRVGEALEEFTRNADAARLRDELRRGTYKE